MANTFFTSDLHFSHQKIIQFCPKFRKFQNIKSMNKFLINFWNSTIQPNDEVYNLGDFSFSNNFKEIINILFQLNGKHHFILGNHDELIRSNKEFLLNEKKNDDNPLLFSINDLLTIKLNKRKEKIILCHYPLFEWNASIYGSILLHGHIHNQIAPIKGKILNVSYDLHGKLLTINDINNYLTNIPIADYFCFENNTNTENNEEWISNKIREINS